MATKKVTPKDPEAKAVAKADGNATSRKTAGMRFPRKPGARPRSQASRVGGASDHWNVPDDVARPAPSKR